MCFSAALPFSQATTMIAQQPIYLVDAIHGSNPHYPLTYEVIRNRLMTNVGKALA
jgi:hypothetical protein